MKKEKDNHNIIVDLNGPHGNAYFIMSVARHLSRSLDVDFKPIEAEMKAGDYNNLIDVVERHFGDYVEFWKAKK